MSAGRRQGEGLVDRRDALALYLAMMNAEIDLTGLRTAVSERSPGGVYVLTVSAAGGPHVVHVAVGWEGDRLVAEVGATTAANASARPHVSLLYPVRSDDDYSLIVNGTAAVESRGARHRLRVVPTRAVLHRAGPPPDPAASCCTSDCVPLLASLPAGSPPR